MEWEPTEKYWETRYRDGRTGWDRGKVHPALLDWVHRGALKPCSILVPGCGNGYEVVFLAEIGFEVTGIDFAGSPLKTLRKNLDSKRLRAKIVQEDFLSWSPSILFDAIYEQTCLCAIDPSMRRGYEQQVHQILRPGGSLLALFMQNPGSYEEPPFHCELKEMERLFESSRWTWEKSSPSMFSHPNGNIFEMGVQISKLK